MHQQQLHANWQFLAPENDRWLSAAVPGCIHTDLIAHDLIPDPYYGTNELDLQWIEDRTWSYKLEFSVDGAVWDCDVVDLVCDGLDTVATVTLNGAVILESDNMFQQHRLNIKNRLVHGANTLEVRFDSAIEYVKTHHTLHTEQPAPGSFQNESGCNRIRKEQCQFGWDWGARFVTSGIWRPIYLQGWSANRVETVHIAQEHAKDSVTLTLTPTLQSEDSSALYRATVSFENTQIATVSGALDALSLTIPDPKLWWPAGQGEQPLYTLRVDLIDDGQPISEWSRKIGLRTIVLDTDPDEFDVKNKSGVSINRFGLRVNGRLIFSKGANWIPAHCFVAGLTRKDFEPLLKDCVDSNMNIVRIWGGGVYEHDDFYDVCDEMGLLVWQDFMFACYTYPGDPEYLESVKKEAVYQVSRLRHHASLALWCGNNEIILLKPISSNADLKEDYINVFLKTLPEVVNELDPAASYIHSSPAFPVEGVPESDHGSFDEHDWNVWHSKAPVGHYEKTNHRYVSEFGMQSYPSPQVAATFCPPDELNILSPTFELHQKNGGGNTTIFHYVMDQFRFPKDYRSTAYLSQVNQAYCMKVGIEHFRSQQPQCLGAIYWQLNDCWPVASWSSIEFGGNWKALQYYAKRFYAPHLVCIKRHGEDRPGHNNYRVNTRGVVDIYTVSDDPETRSAELSWQLCTLKGDVIMQDARNVTLEYGTSVLRETVDFTEVLGKIGKENTYLLVRLADASSGKELSRDIALFSVPRMMSLGREPIEVKSARTSETRIDLTLTASEFKYGVCIEATAGAKISDSYFPLCAGETRTVQIEYPKGSEAAMPLVYSLVDTY